MTKINVLFVCLGNICRSPMAEGILKEKIKSIESDEMAIDSAGTGNWHIGELPDERMRLTAKNHGIELVSRARQFVKEDFQKYDFIIAMDEDNKSNILALAENANQRDKVYKMRDFDELNPGADVPDPYFGGQSGFENVFEILSRSIDVFINQKLQPKL